MTNSCTNRQRTSVNDLNNKFSKDWLCLKFSIGNSNNPCFDRHNITQLLLQYLVVHNVSKRKHQLLYFPILTPTMYTVTLIMSVVTPIDADERCVILRTITANITSEQGKLCG